MSLLGKKNLKSMLLSAHHATQNQAQLSDPNSTKNRQKKEFFFLNKGEQLELSVTPIEII